MSKKKQVSKSEPNIPDNKRQRFEELVDMYMDKHNLTADAAREKALDTLNLDESFKRTMRKLSKRGDLNAVEKEVARLGARHGRDRYNLDLFGNVLSSDEKKKEERNVLSLKRNIQKLALAAHPNFSGEQYSVQQQAARLDRDEMKKIGRNISNKVYAKLAAEDIIDDLPVVKVKQAKEKASELARVLRMMKLGLI